MPINAVSWWTRSCLLVLLLNRIHLSNIVRWWRRCHWLGVVPYTNRLGRPSHEYISNFISIEWWTCISLFYSILLYIAVLKKEMRLRYLSVRWFFSFHAFPHITKLLTLIREQIDQAHKRQAVLARNQDFQLNGYNQLIILSITDGMIKL